jgi:hypothetical protein
MPDYAYYTPVRICDKCAATLAKRKEANRSDISIEAPLKNNKEEKEDGE